MADGDRVQLFDEWAAGYDESVETYTGFPFDGYERVLDEVTRQADVRSGMSVLDLGVGTGKLAERFCECGCCVWGLDFSTRMLAICHRKLPQIELIKADVHGDWPIDVDQRFDRIVSGYLLHEFDLASKTRLLRRLVERHLESEGRVVIGDVAFETTDTREEARRKYDDLWDEDEHYWAADEAIAALEKIGVTVSYVQVSFCCGVFLIERTNGQTDA